MNLNKRKLAGHGRKNFKQADRINFANTKLSLIQDLVKKAKDTNLKGRFFLSTVAWMSIKDITTDGRCIFIVPCDDG